MPRLPTARAVRALAVSLLFAAAALVAPSLAPRASIARADGVADEAELQFQRGAEAYRKGDFTAALEHFLASNRLVRNRNVMFNIARAYEQLQRFADAYRYYVDALGGEEDPATRKTVEAAIARITPMVAVIAVTTKPAGATVYIGRKDLGSVGTTPSRLGLPAGTYTILVERPGYEPAQSKPLEIKVGTTTNVELPLVRVVGRVVIEGDTGADVRVDDESGKPACQSPCQLELAPGQHTLFFGRPGFATSPRVVSVVARERVVVRANLAPLTGAVLVAADEPNALIEIDGRAVGFAPTVVPGVPVGTRHVRVSLHGYQPVERDVVVEADKQVDLRDLVLVPIREIAAASRTVESVDDAPASVTVIGAQEIEAFGYPTLYEALRGVRGVALNYDSTYGNASIRGLGRANDFSNRMLVLGDGAVLNENILYQPFIHYDGRVDLGDVERIEIVRGPGSVLYGTGAVSGVVNLVTRGRDDPSGVDLGLSAADDAVARGRAAVKLRLGADTGLWASAAIGRSSGRTVELDYDAGDGLGVAPHPVHDFDRFDAYTVAGRFWHEDLTLQWFFTSRHLKVSTGAYDSIIDDDKARYDDQRGLAELRYEPRLGPSLQLASRVYANYTYFGSNVDYPYDDPAAPPGVVQGVEEDYHGAWAGGELRFLLDLGAHLRLSFGGEVARHFLVKMEDTQAELSGPRTRLLRVSAPYNVYAGYANLDWRVSPVLKLVAGARVDRWDLSQDQRGFTGLALTEDFTSVSPRIALVLHADAQDIVKLMVGRAFRAPSTYEYFYTDGFYTQATSDCCSKTPLQPETVWSAEIENIYRFDADWAFVLSGYGIYAEKIIETAEVPDAIRDANGWPEGIFYYRNSDTAQRVLGVDAELRREWRGGTMLAAQYGFQSSRAVSGDTGRVPNQPAHLASFKAVTPLFAAGGLTGAARVSLEAPRRVSSDSPHVTDVAVVADAVLSGNLARPGVRWSAGIYNLFDWKYALPAEPYASPTMPQLGRSLLLNVTVTR
jgi:outer membrane receptor protein involved in Fe transport